MSSDPLEELLAEYEEQLKKLDNAHDAYIAKMVSLNQPVLKTSPVIVEFNELRTYLVDKIDSLKKIIAQSV